LQKLAQVKQIVGAGLESTIADARVPKEVRDHATNIMNRINKAIPFDHNDLIQLEQKQQVTPDITLKDVVKMRGKTTAAPANNDIHSAAEAILRGQ
jgi:hypothetical protein